MGVKLLSNYSRKLHEDEMTLITGLIGETVHPLHPKSANGEQIILDALLLDLNIKTESIVFSFQKGQLSVDK